MPTQESLEVGMREPRGNEAAGAALLALGSIPAYAAQPSLGGLVGAVDETDCEPSPAELEDIAFIAEQDGIPMDEAIARYGNGRLGTMGGSVLLASQAEPVPLLACEETSMGAVPLYEA